jgi:hypothetical protein
MTLPRHADDPAPLLTWADVVSGAPSIIGFAALAGRAIATNARLQGELGLPAQALLLAARDRGSLEIKASKNAYDSAQRLLAVYVELAPERFLSFRSATRPQYTIEMLDGFRQLCAAGMVMHHLGHDFSLTHAGMLAAAGVQRDLVASLLAEAVELDFDE